MGAGVLVRLGPATGLGVFAREVLAIDPGFGVFDLAGVDVPIAEGVLARAT